MPYMHKCDVKNASEVCRYGCNKYPIHVYISHLIVKTKKSYTNNNKKISEYCDVC